MLKKMLLPLIVFALTFISCEVSETAAPAPVTVVSLTVTPASIDALQLQDSVTLVVAANYSDGSTKVVSTKTEYSASAHYSTAGAKMTALTEGSGVLTATYSGASAAVPYSTVENYTGITLQVNSAAVTSLTADVGDTIEFTAVVTPKSGSPITVTKQDGLVVTSPVVWYNETSVTEPDATVTCANTLRAVDGGTGTVTATYFSQTVTIPVTVSDYVFGARRFIPDSVLSMKAVSYSGYRQGQSPGTFKYPSTAEILEDLNILDEAGFRFLRLYDTSPHAYRTLQMIADNSLPFKVQLGVWIDGPDSIDNTPNWKQVDGVFDLLAKYPGIIVSVSVGNECMVDWNTWAAAPAADVKKYIQFVRANATVPVTTDENWEPFSVKDISNDPGETGILAAGAVIKSTKTNAPYDTEQVARVIDYLALHTYPIADSPWSIWDWKRQEVTAGPARGVAMMDLALKVAKKQYQAARDHMDELGLTAMPIIISETGWKHNTAFAGLSHPVNAKMYYDRMMDWTYGAGRGATATDGPWVCFYFEAFNEPWKAGDDGWGLFTVDRKPTYAIYAQNDTDAFVKPDGATAYTDADVNYFGK